MYHALCLVDVRILQSSGVCAEHLDGLLSSRLCGMERALSIMSHPDGDISLFNDSWLGEAPRTADIVRARPCRGKHVLEDSGYVRLDSGDAAVIFDCGRCGPADNPGHAHADYLSFECSHLHSGAVARRDTLGPQPQRSHGSGT
jgi:uncharacterized heparinase superfamily protein